MHHFDDDEAFVLATTAGAFVRFVLRFVYVFRRGSASVKTLASLTMASVAGSIAAFVAVFIA